MVGDDGASVGLAFFPPLSSKYHFPTALYEPPFPPSGPLRRKLGVIQFTSTELGGHAALQFYWVLYGVSAVFSVVTILAIVVFGGVPRALSLPSTTNKQEKPGTSRTQSTSGTVL